MMNYSDALDMTNQAEKIFYEVVDDPTFNLGWDAPTHLISNELKERMKVPCFGDYLKRYIHKAQGIPAEQGIYPLEYYIESIVNSFKERETPSSFDKSSTTLKNAAKNWLTRKTASRKTAFLLGLGLKMSAEEVDELLTKALYEQRINPKDPFEVICWYCFINGFNYLAYESLWDEYCELSADCSFDDFSSDLTSNIRHSMYAITNEEMLFSYLSLLKANENLSKFSRSAKKEFDALYNEIQVIVGNDKGVPAEDVSPFDVEAYIYSGIPKTDNGNLFKENMSDFKDIFAGKRLNRQRIGQLVSGKTEVTRFDLITLSFVTHANRYEVAPQKRYYDFCKNTNDILHDCSMQGLIVQNPYENFVMACLLAKDPMGTYWDVWADSFGLEEFDNT